MDYNYICLDLETTHLNPVEGVVLEFGAVIENMDLKVSELPTFRRLVVQRNGHYFGDPIAIAMNAGLFQEIADGAKAGYPPNDLWCYKTDLPTEFFKFIKQHLGTGQKSYTYGGKNFEGFDKQWIETHFPNILLNFPPYYRTVDPGALYYLPSDKAKPPSLQKCKERAGITGDVEHEALADAFDVIKVIRKAKGVPID